MNPWTPLVVAILGWGSAAVLAGAIIEGGVDTFTMLPLRLGIALATTLLVSIRWARFRSIDGRQWGRGAMLGVIALGIPNALLTLALEDLPVSMVGLLIALIPAATISAAHFLVPGERFNPKSIPGLLLSLAGTVFLVGIGAKGLTGVGNLGRGVSVALIGVMLAGAGGALTRRYALEVGADGLVVPQFASATILYLIAYPFLATTTFSSIDGGQWGLIILLGTVATAVPFTAFLLAAQVNSATRLGMIGYLVPVIAVALAVALLGETFTAPIAAGAALILGGVVLTERASRHVPEPGIATAQ